MSRSEDADVIVAGAGIAGLGLACALAEFDVRVLLLEKRRAPGGIHRGDSLLPKSTRLFRRWGVLDAIRAAGAQPIDHVEIHDGEKKVAEAPLVPQGGEDPYLVLPHARIEHVLTEQALASGNVQLVRPARVVDLIRENGRVVGVRSEGAQGALDLRARLVVATDGHKSVIREKLGITVLSTPYDHAYLGLEADRPSSYENAMRVHFHPEGGLLVMPRTDRVGIGLLVGAGERHWLSMTDDELKARLVPRAPILAGMKLHRDGAHVYELVRAHATRYVSDGAVIIGDAAHCTNPTAGQGMTTALGDAGFLASLVGPALEEGRDLLPVLERYEREQWARNHSMIKGSHRLARLYATRGRGWHRLKVGAARFLGSSLGRVVTRPIVEAFLRGAKDLLPPPRPRRSKLESVAVPGLVGATVDERYED